MLLDTPTRRRGLPSLTPLIDVVFILLLFFMLTTQFERQQAMAIQVPGVGSAPADDRVTPLRLSADGVITLPDGSTLRADQAADSTELARLLVEGATPRLAVDDDVDLQSIVSWLDELDAVGFAGVSIRGLVPMRPEP